MLNTAAALVALSMLVPATATAEEDPVASVEVVTVNGSGCAAGDADVRTEGRTFSIGYHTFLARAGGGSSPTDLRKNCQLSLRVNTPAGYTYGLSRTSYHGYVHLQSGATGLNRVSVYVQGSAQTTTVNHAFTGPINQEWDTSYRPGADIVWVPCGKRRNININAELRVNLGSSDPDRLNFLIVESSTGAVRIRRC